MMIFNQFPLSSGENFILITFFNPRYEADWDKTIRTNLFGIIKFVLIIWINRLSLFLFVSILSQSFFTLVRRHLMPFSFFSAWHLELF